MTIDAKQYGSFVLICVPDQLDTLMQMSDRSYVLLC